jgi:hypothetical protein
MTSVAVPKQPGPISTTKLSRVDVGAIRKKLMVALGPERFRNYWETFKAFAQFQLSKEELDKSAKSLLGEDNVPVHNELVRGQWKAFLPTNHASILNLGCRNFPKCSPRGPQPL